MNHRMKTKVRAMTWAAVFGAGAAFFPNSSLAQDKDKLPPVLPPTKIEAKPPTVVDAPPTGPVAPFPGGDFPGAGGSGVPNPLSQGGIFGSPAVTGYGANSFTTGSIVDIPRLDFPGSVGVVTRDMIVDQQALSIEDVLRDVSSAQKLGDFRRPDSFLLRGFEITSRDYRWNGFLDPSFAPRDVQNISRIEFLKGPSSVLYGSGQPSGVVNVITKKAQSEFGGSLNYQFGSWALNRPTLDVTGPAGDGLAYRVNFAYQNVDSFRDFGFDERTFVAPVLSYLLDENTLIEYQGQYMRDRNRLDSGLYALGGNSQALPIQTSLNQPTDYRHFDDAKTGLWITHRLNENWSARAGGYMGNYQLPSLGSVPVLAGNNPAIGFLGLPPNVLLRQVQAGTETDEAYYSFIGNLAGDFDGAMFHHKLLLGMEFGWLRSNNSLFQFSDPLTLNPIPFPPFFFPTPSSPINSLAPNYAVPQPPFAGFLQSQYAQDRYGFYLQDFVDLTDRLKLLAGVRYDVVDFKFNRQLVNPFGGVNIGFPQTNTDTNYYHLSPRVGLTYFLVPETVSAYASYSQSFDPPPGGAYRSNIQLQPELGYTGEAGLRMSLLDKKLLVDMSAFYITKDNVTTQDNFFFVSQIGQQRSQGFEMSAVGQVSEAFSVITNYAYIDSRITDAANPLLIGNRFRNVPYNTLNLWGRYNLVDTCQQTLGVGLGMTALGDRPGDLNNSFELPSYVRWDAGVFYRYGRMNANLYVENIFDRRYDTSSIDQFSVFPGAPITARAMVGINF